MLRLLLVCVVLWPLCGGTLVQVAPTGLWEAESVYEVAVSGPYAADKYVVARRAASVGKGKHFVSSLHSCPCVYERRRHVRMCELSCSLHVRTLPSHGRRRIYNELIHGADVDRRLLLLCCEHARR